MASVTAATRFSPPSMTRPVSRASTVSYTHLLEGLAVQFLLDGIVDSGDTGGTADHQDLLQVRGTQACILQSLAAVSYTHLA